MSKTETPSAPRTAPKADEGLKQRQSRAPFDMSEDLQARARALGVEGSIADLRDIGFSVIRDPATLDFNARLRDAILRTSKRRDEYFSANKEGANAILGADPIFEEALLNPKILAVAEAVVGGGAVLSTLGCSIRRKGMNTIGLHVDQGVIATPFPEHVQTVTFCWACDEFTEESGATGAVPGSYKHRRSPTPAEGAELAGLVPIVAPAGSITVWRGDTWHTNYPRQIDGERVVLHVAFNRLANRPIENYDHLDEAWLKDKPYALRVMLGREDYLNKRGGLGVMTQEQYRRTHDWVHG